MSRASNTGRSPNPGDGIGLRFRPYPPIPFPEPLDVAAVEPGAPFWGAARVPILLRAPTALGFSHEARALGPADVEIGAKVAWRK